MMITYRLSVAAYDHPRPAGAALTESLVKSSEVAFRLADQPASTCVGKRHGESAFVTERVPRRDTERVQGRRRARPSELHTGSASVTAPA